MSEKENGLIEVDMSKWIDPEHSKATVWVPISKKDRDSIRKVLNELSKQKTDEQIFYHMCFCIMAPQTTYRNNIRCLQSLVENDFYHKDIDRAALELIIKKARFYRNKTRYLLDMKVSFAVLLGELRKEKNIRKKRDILITKVRGLGLKAASHFMRNMGESTLAIIDTHTLKFLGWGTQYPKNIVEYVRIEDKFKDIAKEHGVSPAFLDLLVWKKFSKTDIQNDQGIMISGKRTTFF